MPQFSHLHCHTQYSLLDGATNIGSMMKKAAQDNMPAVALTDHGNMFGAFKFVAEASKHGVKPIVGCEFYLVEDRFRKEFTKGEKDLRYHQLLLAKNEQGYKNLSKLCSLGYIDGLYSKWPRIDKALLAKYQEGLIATTCCIGAEIPQAILHKSEEEAEKLFRWWLDRFGEDYYVELQRHQLDDQEKVNQVLLRFAKKYGVKIIATNDSHYLDREDFNAHDILLCINTGEFQSKPVWKGDGFGGRDYRFGFPNDEFYFKNTQEMGELFHDLPEALDNTNEIVDKVNTPQLKRDILLPNFPIPEPFANADDYLRHLTYEGARSTKRYGENTDSTEVKERIDHELNIIKTMGFSGYFLITADFIKAGRDLGVLVGPGRGSAAGSVVAYCIGITNIDPIKYNLLFERFLNPERVSMPDIDTDFDDEGRQAVIDYVVEKYGRNQVAQIITYGTMAAKMAIKDVARVTELPLPEANALAKLIPDKPGTTLNKAIKEVKELQDILNQGGEHAEVIKQAQKLEGSVRNSGIHAAGVIIAPDDLTDYIPVSTSKDSDLLITQFDGKVVEDAGMLKMDFLGLKTLTIIKDALKLIKDRHGVELDMDNLSLYDDKTFGLYQRGDTIGTFQFESPGMRKYLQELKPTDIEDLIAMNALYRPGPMEFIPNFIRRKHGKESVDFPHELLEGILKPSYGIMVYQEQIMQTAQIIAGYSLGQADLLRRAMGKKKMEEMERQRVIFIDGAKEKHDIGKDKANEIFDIMQKFAAYGFNRSHSAAYSVVAYQTAFLKANYPEEYMASVLTHNQNNIEKVTFFMDECKRQGIKVLGPSVNESQVNFSVNPEGQIRFGLGAIKGSGEAAVESIIAQRAEDGPYKDIFDFTERVNLRAVNKKTMEALAMGGAFDAFEAHRRQYLDAPDGEASLIELSTRYAQQKQAEAATNQQSLFGAGSGVEIAKPKAPNMPPYSEIEKLRIEKEVVGFYISGHPLDQFKLEMEHFTDTPLSALQDLEKLPQGRTLHIGGIVSSAAHRMTKNGKPFGILQLEDYEDSYQFYLFGDDYIKLKEYLNEGWFLYVSGEVAKPRWKDELEFKITKIDLLDQVRERNTAGITLQLNILDLTPELLNALEQLSSKHEGSAPLRITVHDPESNFTLDMGSRRYRINPGNDFLQAIEAMPQLRYKLMKAG